MDRIRKKKISIVAAIGAGALFVVGFALFGMSGRAQSGPPQNDMAVDKAARNEVIDGAIANLDKNYVFPEKAAAMGKQLRAKLQHGDYDDVTSAKKLASTLTEDLQQASHDKHLVVLYFEKPVAEPSAKQDADDKAAELVEQQHFNFGFENVDRLHGGIGYIDLHQFARPQGAAKRIAAAMDLLGDTKALIIDLRDCDGGDPDTVMLFASYLFDKRTHLNDVYWRDENRIEERWTTDTVPGRKYGSARKLYLLTSGDTFSGCEDFAYALKNAGRVTLVGETTGGGAHGGNPHRLSAHFMMFVPSGLPINPVTHTNWEGVGVTPNVQTSAKNALDVAQIAILKQLIATETDPDWRQRLQHRLADLE